MKHSLSELAQRILAVLEEAGEENVSSTLNTVLAVHGGAQEIVNFREAIVLLLSDGLADLVVRSGSSGDFHVLSRQESIVELSAFEQTMDFDTSEGIWVWDKRKPRAYVRLTDKGQQESERILTDRGYQWWRQ